MVKMKQTANRKKVSKKSSVSRTRMPTRLRGKSQNYARWRHVKSKSKKQGTPVD